MDWSLSSDLSCSAKDREVTNESQMHTSQTYLILKLLHYGADDDRKVQRYELVKEGRRRKLAGFQLRALINGPKKLI